MLMSACCDGWSSRKRADVVILQVSISEADLQAMGGTITMVTQEGTTITIPAHELMSQGHSVTMVTEDGTEGQVYINY